MNVASLELCKELFQLSGWDNNALEVDQWWYQNPNGDWARVSPEFGGVTCPAYDLSYLLRKLPASIEHEYPNDLEVSKEDDEKYWAYYCRVDEDIVTASGGTPEDAAAKLAIELFKTGVLKKGDDKS